MTKATGSNNVDDIRVLQFSDPHIFAAPDREFDGFNTADTLRRVLELAQVSDWPARAVLVTGDLVHEASVEAYQQLRAPLSSLDTPVYCLPGNHDDPALMQEVLPGDNIHVTHQTRMGNWLLVFLDSYVPGTHGGHLSENELQRLDRSLSLSRAEHVLVCLHHPPVLIGSAWMDEMRLDNPEALFAVLDRFEQVRAVIWGHIHQEYLAVRRGIRLMSAPSTCIQFKPKTDAFEKDDLGPGYRWLLLRANGEVETGIRRVSYRNGG